jgi:hypothetical protein
MKSLKQFMVKNNVNAFEGTETLILNAIVDKTPYGLDVDTSEILGGTALIKYDSFITDGDNIIIGDITINSNNVFMLGMDSESIIY